MEAFAVLPKDLCKQMIDTYEKLWKQGIKKWGKANLDVDKKFITVIPEKHIHDLEFVEYEIVKNRVYSVQNRDEILEYAQTFDWKNVIQNTYLPNVNEVLSMIRNKILE